MFSLSAGEFWLGLEKIHSIAKDGGYILNIKLSDWGNDLASVRFLFQLGGKETKYSLKIEEAETFSTLESSLGTDATSGLPFSTRDQDSDQKNDTNCAKHLSGQLKITNCKPLYFYWCFLTRLKLTPNLMLAFVFYRWLVVQQLWPLQPER